MAEAAFGGVLANASDSGDPGAFSADLSDQLGDADCEEGHALPGTVAGAVIPTTGTPTAEAADGWRPPLSGGGGRGGLMRRLVKKVEEPARPVTTEQRLLLLDTWLRSGLPAGDFAALIGMSKHTLYAWKKRLTARARRD